MVDGDGKARSRRTSMVGKWEYVVAQERVILDGLAAAMFGLDADECAKGVPRFVFLAKIHKVDRAQAAIVQKRLVREGGAFVYEHRVQPDEGSERWIMVRGFYAKGRTGTVERGRGVVFDVTDVHQEGLFDGEPFFLHSMTADASVGAEEQLERTGADRPPGGLTSSIWDHASQILRMTEHLIAAHRIALASGDPELLTFVSAAMYRAGHALRGAYHR